MKSQLDFHKLTKAKLCEFNQHKFSSLKSEVTDCLGNLESLVAHHNCLCNDLHYSRAEFDECSGRRLHI